MNRILKRIVIFFIGETMSLQERQKAEREALLLLVNSIEKNATDIVRLTEILINYKAVRDSDPTHHIVSAMRSYLKEI